MSELITAKNLDYVIQKNNEIKDEILKIVMEFQMNLSITKVPSRPQLALSILQKYGLIQLPIDDKYWSGAIFIKNNKAIPVLNTALPRVNQYFVAWHEIYHLLFDKISFNHIIKSDNTLKERKAEYFAACMLLSGIEQYFVELPEMEFLSKIFFCMSTFQAPYKAVLISLYEYAMQSNNETLCNKIKEVFDLEFGDMPLLFQKLGLDNNIVKPSYVVNTSCLQGRIRKKMIEYPELKYHKDNEEFLINIMKEITMMIEKGKT